MVEPEEESDQDDEPYLHPSLASSLTKIEAVRFTRYILSLCTLYINLFLKMHKRSLRSRAEEFCVRDNLKYEDL